MAAATIEIPFLASHYGLSEASLTTLTQAPTVDLVNQLLESISTKAREFDDLKSDKLRLEVELENSVRSSESKTKVLKASVEKGLTEIHDLRTRLQESGNFHLLLNTYVALSLFLTAAQRTTARTLNPRFPL
jgi:nucleoprotein TPR